MKSEKNNQRTNCNLQVSLAVVIVNKVTANWRNEMLIQLGSLCILLDEIETTNFYCARIPIGLYVIS